MMSSERKRIGVMPDRELVEGFLSTPPTAIFKTNEGEFERTRPAEDGVLPAPLIEMPDKDLLEDRLNGKAYFDLEAGKLKPSR